MLDELRVKLEYDLLNELHHSTQLHTIISNLSKL